MATRDSTSTAEPPTNSTSLTTTSPTLPEDISSARAESTIKPMLPEGNLPSARADSTSSIATPNASPNVVKSNAVEANSQKEYAFRGWIYATAQASLGSMSNQQFSICLDTGCTMSLVDRGFPT